MREAARGHGSVDQTPDPWTAEAGQCYEFRLRAEPTRRLHARMRASRGWRKLPSSAPSPWAAGVGGGDAWSRGCGHHRWRGPARKRKGGEDVDLRGGGAPVVGTGRGARTRWI